MAKMIGASGPKLVLSIRGIKDTGTVETESEKVTLNISGTRNKKSYRLQGVRTIKDLSLHEQTLRVEDVVSHPHLEKIAVEYYQNARPTILLGQDNWNLIVSREVLEGNRGAPVASFTALGWVIHGYVTTTRQMKQRDTTLYSHQDMQIESLGQQQKDDDDQLHELVKANFRMEAIGVKHLERASALEERATQLLQKYTHRVAGHWETGLLWKEDAVWLPENRENALLRLKNLEHKMDRDPLYAELYYEQMTKFIELGYAEKVSDVVSEGSRVWYLPHFGVINPNQPGKLRLVFDAAAKTRGVCLNDKLLAGPDMLTSLLGVLMRFRQKRVAFMGDIKEMFLQIKIREEDREVQRFLWRGKDRTRNPDTYHMNSMVFGAKSSPCTALYVKNRNASEHADDMPLAARAIVRKCYMDDYLDSADTDEEATTLIRQVMKINLSGGFKMHKWASNSQAVVNSIPRDQRASGPMDLTLDEQAEHYEKTLGLKWNPRSDTFTFEVGLKRIPADIAALKRRPTKREMLKIIMSLFDPLGFLTPFTIRSKILLQDVWRSGVGWDQVLKDTETESWQRWLGDLAQLRRCAIPRCYLSQGQDTTGIELHTFCDASEKAYSAVAYWRLQYVGQPVIMKFIASKSRVAPLKPCSIPRLELQAAVLASRLAQTIIAEHEIQAISRTFWTDSRTVLSWICSDPRTYKTFVAHRLGEIDELTNANEWKWVPSADNPADDATRDVPIDLDYQARWFQGPAFLRRAKALWPKQPSTPAQSNHVDSESERRAEFVAAQGENPSPCLPEVERFSSWSRLIRTTAWILYYVEVCRNGAKTGLTVQLLERAETLWVKRVQADSFRREMRALKEGRELDRGSGLLQLSPQIDKQGLLRVQSRADVVTGVPEAAKAPVILDGRHPATRLLVQNYHQKMGHGSNEMVVNELRQKYWITRLRPTVRSVASRCLLCHIRRAQAQPPRMGDLPSARVAHHHRPFTFCGLDYFGPMYVTIGRRNAKRWGVLFTCLTTRAVHLEVAASLTTDSAIMALRRMVARRGQPTEIYSDNGTNLRGADTELKRALEEVDTSKQEDYATNQGIRWKFIPPAAPHMGGSWERMVRCVKVALRATLKDRAPKEEVLLTLLAEAEHTVNSRPLTHVSVDHRDMEALTPNHFLIGASSGGSIPGKFQAGDICSKKQWRVAQRMADQFWQRWVKEYLPTLAPRRRWNNDVRPLGEGDVVIIMDSNLPRNTWPKGIIDKTYPGKDGRIRMVDVRTSRGVLTRPATKIITLIGE